ncbi:hypothetical protein UlMin_026760 [Ulmus minor]
MDPIIDYLKICKVPEDKNQARRLRIKAARYTLLDGVLYKKSFSGPLLRCIIREESEVVLKSIHSGVCGNHSGGQSLAHKALTAGYLMPRFLVMDNETQFNNVKVEGFAEMYGIKINFSPVYHPQANGMAEATNKLIVGNLRRNFEERGGVWLEELPNVL